MVAARVAARARAAAAGWAERAEAARPAARSAAAATG